MHIALWGAALWAAKLLLTQTSVLSVGVEGQFQTALDNSARAAGVVILSSAVLMTSVVLLGPIRKRLAASVAALRSLGGRSRRLIAIVASKLIEFMSDVWTRISRVVRQLKHLRFEFPRVDFGGLMKLSFDFNFSRSAQSARTIAERFMRSVATAARQYGKPLLKVFGSRVRVFLASGSVLVLAGSLMPAAPDVPFDDYHVPLAEVPELPSDPVELEVENFVDHSPLTKIEAVPVSLCELPPGSADWAFGREDKLEAYVADCRLPYEARTGSGALVVVGISSLHGDRAEENRRAARRGQALARHAYATASDNIDIYVLNLGTAQRGNPLRKLRDLFGRASGDRPVAGLLFRPVPDNALVLGIDVADELNEYLRDRGVSDDFASCSLYQFRPAPREEDQLRPVKWFKCGRS